MRTPFVRKEDVAGDKYPRNWWIVDAEGKTLGRVATQIARALRGKHKAVFAPHSDVGDFVIVVNAEKIQVTGQKSMKKMLKRPKMVVKTKLMRLIMKRHHL